jgi:hypothetical protein
MTADGLSSMTLGSLLFGQDNEDSGALVLSPSWEDFQGSLAGFSAELAGMSRETLGREVATAISDAEDMQLGDLMIYGWRTHRHLMEAARQTLSEPGTKQVVHLASQRLPLTRHPVVDLTVGGVCVYSAHFTVTVTFDVAVADAVVRQGRLTEVTVGGYSVVVVLEAELPAGNVELLRRQHRGAPRLVVRLGQGIVLASTEQHGPEHAASGEPRHAAGSWRRATRWARPRHREPDQLADTVPPPSG